MPRSLASKVALKVSRNVLNVFLLIIFYAVITMLIVRASKEAYGFAYQLFGSMSVDPEPGYDVEIQVIPGEDVYTIAQKLKTKEVIINKYSFFLKIKLKGSVIMPGTYKLNTSMDYDDILAVITDATKSMEAGNAS